MNDRADRLLQSYRTTGDGSELPPAPAVYSRARQRTMRRRAAVGAAGVVAAGALFGGGWALQSDFGDDTVSTVPAAQSPTPSGPELTSVPPAPPAPTSSATSGLPAASDPPTTAPPRTSPPAATATVSPQPTGGTTLSDGSYCGDFVRYQQGGEAPTLMWFRPWVASDGQGASVMSAEGKLVELPVAGTVTGPLEGRSAADEEFLSGLYADDPTPVPGFSVTVKSGIVVASDAVASRNPDGPHGCDQPAGTAA